MKPYSRKELKNIKNFASQLATHFNVQKGMKTGVSFEEYLKENNLNDDRNQPAPLIIEEKTSPTFANEIFYSKDSALERTYSQTKSLDIADWADSLRAIIGNNTKLKTKEEFELKQNEAEESSKEKTKNTDIDREEEAELLYNLAKNSNAQNYTSNAFKFKANSFTQEEYYKAYSDENASQKSEYVDSLLGLYIATKELDNNRSIWSKIFNWNQNRKINNALKKIEDTLVNNGDDSVFSKEEFDAITNTILKKDLNKIKEIDSDGEVISNKKSKQLKAEESPSPDKDLSNDNITVEKSEVIAPEKLSEILYQEFDTRSHKAILNQINNNPEKAKEIADRIDQMTDGKYNNNNTLGDL